MAQFIEWLIDFGSGLDWLLNLIGLLGYPLAIYLWLRERARYQRLRRLITFRPAKGAVAVILGVGVPSVKPDAEKFIREQFDPPLPVVLTYDKQGFFSREQLLDIIHEVRDRVRELMVAGGIREVHLFYGGPLAVAAALGAITDNWVPVRWYNHNKKTGQYEYMFTLDVETVKGV
jgi:hypothetical protein